MYGVLMGGAAQALFTLALRVYGSIRGVAAVDHVLGFIEQRYAFSGWPLYGHGWTNLHVSRFTSRVRHRYRGISTPPARRGSAQPLSRVACVGAFVGTLGFPRELLAACPLELVIADAVFNDRHAGYLAADAAAYDSFDFSSPGDVDRAADFINRAKPDLVINIGNKYNAFELFDRLDAPCLANFCAGSDLLHHPRVDIQYFSQPEADYFVRDERMFCGTTAAFFDDRFVHGFTGFIDPRGLLHAARRPWREREPLIVCHGSLYKFASEPFMQVLWSWLARGPERTLVLMGRDDGKALDAITRSARQAGVADRVDYRGTFSAVRDESGTVSSAGWFDLVDLLGRARLAPNPFPLGGGSSRFEAYALGVPAPHLGVRFDPDAWGRPQPSICEIPAMLTPQGTAWSVAEFQSLGERLMNDEAHADALAQEQVRRAEIFGDANRWWREITAGYDRWRARAGHA